MKDWEEIFKEKKEVLKKPNNQLIKVIPEFKKNKVKKILDHGCGTGRHYFLMKSKGFDVYGCDNSKTALRFIKQIDPKAKLKQCDMSKLPYNSSFFDGVISVAVIQHAKINKIKDTIKEIFRVLKKKGLLFLITISDKDPSYKTGKEIEKNTKIDIDQIDGKIPHHFFNKKEIVDLFYDFDVLSLKHNTRKSFLIPNKRRCALVLLARKR